jgi:hypothetical protein
MCQLRRDQGELIADIQLTVLFRSTCFLSEGFMPLEFLIVQLFYCNSFIRLSVQGLAAVQTALHHFPSQGLQGLQLSFVQSVCEQVMM